MILFILLVVLTISGVVVAQDNPVPVPVIYEGTVKIESDDPQLKDLMWHRWTAGNFTILALNDQQGKYLAQNVNNIKYWALHRWGLPDVPLTAECRLLCVYDVQLMNKLFRLSRSRVEARKEDSQTKMYAGWILTDGDPSVTLPVPLTQVCLNQVDETYSLGLDFWAMRGLGMLNLPVSKIKEEIIALQQHLTTGKSVYFFKTLLNMDQSSYDKLSDEDKCLFDRQAMILSLLLRKEFGQDKLHAFMNSDNNNPESLLQRIYLFKDYSQFDASLMRYTGDLCADVVSSRTPDSYLTITPAK